MPNADESYSAEQLAAELNITTRTLREWIRRKLLPRPPLRGRATRYSREHLVRGRAIGVLRRQNVELDVIQRRLARADEKALLAIAAPASGPPREQPAPVSYPHERWQKVSLLPGLELLVREDASGALQRVAQEIYRFYGPA